MSENTEVLNKQENPKSGNIFSIFSNFKFQLPFFNPKQAPKVVVKDDARETRIYDEDNRSQKPDVVTFPKAQLTVPPSLAVENEEPGKTSNPIILWQCISDDLMGSGLRRLFPLPSVYLLCNVHGYRTYRSVFGIIFCLFLERCHRGLPAPRPLTLKPSFVYALGGFLVLRWIWARWNERKAQNDSKNDDQSDDQPAVD